MKKLSIFAFALVLLMTLAACNRTGGGGNTGSNNGKSNASNINVENAGHYQFLVGFKDEEEISAEEMEELGYNYYVKLNKDGTAEVMTDNLGKGAWEDGKIHLKEDDGSIFTLEYKIKDGLLSIEFGDLMLFYSKE